MGSPLSDRRQIENEVVFRQVNEKAQKGLKQLKQVAKEENDQHWAQQSDEGFDFYCECSDENCRIRITQKPSVYEEIHNNRNQFILYPGHQVDALEKVTLEDSNYIVVEKYETPPEQAEGLTATSVNNV
jgi:hypothetical protein